MDIKISQPKLAATVVADLLGISIQAIHKQLKSLDIKCPKVGNKSYIIHNIGKKIFNLSFKKKKVAFQIVKGGTGKTTAIHNVSCAASLYGAKILTIDLDPQGNLTDAFNINPEDMPTMIDVIEEQAPIEDAIIQAEEGIDLIPSRIENVTLDSKLALTRAPLHNVFNNVLEKVEDKYDFILIDCPPMIGHSVTAASLYVDLMLIPLNPDRFSAKGLQILKDEIKNIKKQYKRDLKYKIFLNKFSGNTILSDKTLQTIFNDESEQGNTLSTAVRQSQEIPNIIDQKLNLFSSVKKSVAKDDFDLLTKELLEIEIQKNK
ncbi:ParA family protein [Rickettsiales endosymbiont of Trichoplax sp. H2]|uniref:ParA family protein n=1 Tax=Rickettsiales endosymbiont of Trichoplax sp. H2 TaxID=2021221 RepID=UPI0012B2687D|nr:ParA family protein [Rickettsiales endosymbiont of Trichoplax sp. H2]MSO14646.1 ParA family protein [Rickettsiales endosymbiont of Trichoplax sp. H2]